MTRRGETDADAPRCCAFCANQNHTHCRPTGTTPCACAVVRHDSDRVSEPAAAAARRYQHPQRVKLDDATLAAEWRATGRRAERGAAA